MQIHLCCTRCPCHFSAAADAPASDILDRMNDDAPWFALAEGETFEDMVFAALGSRGKILCPECRAEVLVGGDGLVRYVDETRRPNRPAAPGPERGPEPG